MSSCVNTIQALSDQAAKEGYQLVYIFSSVDLDFDDKKFGDYYCKLVDKKIDYVLSLQEIKCCKTFDTRAKIYSGNNADKDLMRLAYLSGGYSRFRLDDFFAPDDFFRLYETWITKSIKKEIADKVFVIKQCGQILGFITLKYEDNNGRIGLFAVDTASQGRKYGTALMNKCVYDLIQRGNQNIFVATQAANNQACRFYENYGFKKQSEMNLYHMWHTTAP